MLGPQTRERFPEKAILYTQLASFNTHRFGATPGAFDPVDAAMLAATLVPILYVVGSDDILYPPDCIRRVQALVPNSQLVEIAGAGHSAYFEDPAAFNRHLGEFLADCRPAESALRKDDGIAPVDKPAAIDLALYHALRLVPGGLTQHVRRVHPSVGVDIGKVQLDLLDRFVRRLGEQSDERRRRRSRSGPAIGADEGVMVVMGAAPEGA